MKYVIAIYLHRAGLSSWLPSFGQSFSFVPSAGRSLRALLAGSISAGYGAAECRPPRILARTAGLIVITLAGGRDIHCRGDRVRPAVSGRRSGRRWCSGRCRDGRRCGGGRCGDRRFPLVRSHDTARPVRHGNDRAVAVGAPDRDTGQLVERILRGMAIAVACAAGDHGGFGGCRG